ncbi:MAG: ABC transporter ATP-binding protein [Candidatus Parcubacteria bacterium]|nr:ABC transporter ATP-binding protein [Burkholderiales bacterium]
MITLNDVHKRYWTSRGEPHWVLRGISYTFPADRKVAIIGANGAGKSTLIRLIAGIDVPTRGEITRRCRVSWPIGLTGGLLPALSGRQNARFVCRMHGHEEDLRERVEFVHEFSELGAEFDEPVKTYSSGMRSRLNFSLSLAFRFQVYLVDEMMSAGDASFREKARKAFEDLAQSSDMVLVSHNNATVRTFCTEVIWLHEGQIRQFDDVEEAIRVYTKHIVRS